MRPSPLALLVVPLALAGCPKTEAAGGPPLHTPPPAPKAVDTREAEAVAEARWTAHAETLWLAWRGELEGGAPDLWGAVEALDEGLEQVDEALGVPGTAPARRADLLALRRYLLQLKVATTLAPINDRMATLLSATTFDFEGERLALYGLAPRWHQTDDRAERGALLDAAAEALARLDPVWTERDAALEALAEDAGLPGVAGLFAVLGGFELPDALARAEGLLADTDGPWREAIDALAQAEAGVPAADLPPGALETLLTRPSGMSLPSADVGATLETLVSGLGLSPDGDGRIVYQAPSPTQAPGALCVPVSVPTDLRLTSLPGDTPEALATTLRALSTCLVHASFDPTWPWARRHVTGPGAVEALAFPLVSVTLEPAFWTGLGLSEGDAAALTRRRTLGRLAGLRRLAARVVFELERLTTGADATRYRQLMSRAMGYDVGPAADLWRLETGDLPGLVAAVIAAREGDALRAWLTATFGETWWRVPDAGRALHDRWATGQAASASSP